MTLHEGSQSRVPGLSGLAVSLLRYSWLSCLLRTESELAQSTLHQSVAPSSLQVSEQKVSGTL